ncbi:MAG TPA: type IV pilus assembly protein PilM [Solirubrobacterales bacterium]|nr:type IV pilus assembly protein PilM [Solirubrobacterales bacterium]
MQLKLPKKKNAGSTVGLDIEAGSVAATEVTLNGTATVKASAIASLPPGTFHEGEVVEPDRLAAALKALFSQHKLSKRVRLGVANQRVIVRTVRLPAVEDPKELDAAVRFRAQEQIPMPLDQAVLEHQVVGGVPAEEGGAPQVDVMVVAARREMIASLVAPIREAGLQPVGIDLSAFGMIRALATEVAPAPTELGQAPDHAVLYCNFGDVTNLAVARGTSCLFTRTSHVGIGPIVTELGSGLGLTPEHATQWMTYVGLERAAEELEGDPAILTGVRRALEGGVSALADEMRLSLDYYGAQDGALPVERVVLCGPGSAIGGLNAVVEAALSLPVAAARPAALGGFDDYSAARLTLPYGLALEH